MAQQIKKIKTVYRTPWFELISKTVAGQPSNQPYYSIKTMDYVSIVAMTEDKRIVLVRQYRPSVEAFTVELPSGHVEPGQSPARAACEELLEETGFVARAPKLIGSFLSDTGRMTNRTWCFYAEGVKKNVQRLPETGIEPILWAPARLKKAIRSGEFSHGINLAVLFLTLLKQKRMLRGILDEK